MLVRSDMHGLELSLEQATVTLMLLVEIKRVTGAELLHKARDPVARPLTQKQMEMIGH